MGSESGSALMVRGDERDFDVQLALGGFLAGYSGNTRLAYQQDLRLYVGWCHQQGVGLLDVRRTHIELFARWLEHNDAAGTTIARRLSTVAGFYRYCVEEELLTHSPATNVRRPRLRHEATIRGLDRNELGAFLVQAGLSGARDHALACLLALNGLRVSEALGTSIADVGLERGPIDGPTDLMMWKHVVSSLFSGLNATTQPNRGRLHGYGDNGRISCGCGNNYLAVPI